jgi:hypothetical protein
MKPNEKDIMFSLFSEMQDEQLPLNFHENVMHKVQKEAMLRRKRNKRWEIFGYVSGAVAMLTVCVILLYIFGFSFEIPDFETYTWSFPKPDFGMFQSQSFKLSVYVGVLALFLLIADSTIRRHLEKTKHK